MEQRQRSYYDHDYYHDYRYRPYWDYYSNWYWRRPYYPWPYPGLGDDDNYYFWHEYNREG